MSDFIINWDDGSAPTVLRGVEKEDQILLKFSDGTAVNLPQNRSYRQVWAGESSPTDFVVPSVGPQNDNLPLQPVDWPMPRNTIGGEAYDCWYGDPQSIIQDPASGLYYHWSICRNGRGFGSDWWEWVSNDAVSWRFNAIRLDRRRDTNYEENCAFMGGSTIISDGNHGVPAGEVIHCVSMQGWTDDNGRRGEDQNIGILVSRGFGQDVYRKTILCLNQHPGDDWRDPTLFYADGDLFLAICYANHRDWAGIRIYKIDNLAEFHDSLPLVQEMKADGWSANDGSGRRGQSVSGIEVPNVVFLGGNEWLIAYSDQNQQGKYNYPYQSCKGWVCERINGQFEKTDMVQLDFGCDAYARRINNINGKTGGRILSQAMTFNWGFTDWSTGKGSMDWTKGYTGSSGVIEYVLDRSRGYSPLSIIPLDNPAMMMKYKRGNIKQVVPWEAGNGSNKMYFAYAFGIIQIIVDCKPNSQWPADKVFPISETDDFVCLQNKNVIKLQNLSEGWEVVAVSKNY